jgi:predicted enzyme related to lactoylglutathione lyase
MTDPFGVLRVPDIPADPGPAFAARLRARLERTLGLPEGVAVPHTSTVTAADRAALPADHGAAIPYLAVRDARRALDWYADVLGGRLRGEPLVMPGGRIGHAEIELAGGVLYLADEHPEIGFRAPEPGGTPVSLVLAVPDVAAAAEAAVAAGARLDRAPYEAHGYRSATLTDPFGHRWLLQTPTTGVPPARALQPALRQGDAGYASLWVPDIGRAAAFFAAVFGWQYSPEGDPGGRQVQASTPHQGLWGGQPRSTLFCSYVVDDAATAVARVRAAGGQATSPEPRPYGLTADCTDDQGVRFAVHQPPAAGPASGGVRPAARDGDLAYITLEVVDSQRARDFYGAVLGWRFQPGHIADGWQVEGTTPMIGISGGHQMATAVPLWQVGDLIAVTGQVRAAGGTASEAHQEPYGLLAECTDDQGTRFSLGQFPGR